MEILDGDFIEPWELGMCELCKKRRGQFWKHSSNYIYCACIKCINKIRIKKGQKEIDYDGNEKIEDDK